MESTSEFGLSEQYIPAIDDDAAPAVQADEAAPESVAAPADESVEAAAPEVVEEAPASENWFPDRPELNAAIKSLAERIPNLDPNDPDGLKTLRSMAEKDLFIEKLKQQVKQQSEKKLTPFEEQLKSENPVQDQASKPPEQQPQQTAEQQRIDANWRSWSDAYGALSEAWTAKDANGNPAPDFGRLTQIEEAMFARRLENYRPAFEGLVQEMLESRFGQIMPQMEGVVRERTERENLEFALQQLESTEGYNDVRSLFEPVDGQTVNLNGDSYANTPFVQAIQEAPHILDIRVQGRNRAESDRLTVLAQVRAASQVITRMKAREEEIKRANEIGQTIAERTRNQRVRQGLNEGSGTGTLSGGQSRGYVEELLSIPSDGL